MKQSNHKVALGLSGGVDSAVSALLLQQQGYQVTGIRFPCLNQTHCQLSQDQQDAAQVAEILGIPFQQIELPATRKQYIIDYFLDEYQKGRTPNPDVICNQTIKFGWFYDWALEQGFDYIATGHYAKIIQQESKYYLGTSKDQHKDQTYFLHRLQEQQLEKIKFPLGNLLKTEIRQIAAANNLPVAEKKDSTGLCFVCDMSVRQYLSQKLGQKTGKVVTQDGAVIGQHQGAWLYTIGQRRGFSINKKLVQQNTKLLDENQDLPALFVIGKNAKKNQLIVGTKNETQADQFEIKNLHLINPSFKEKLNQQQLKVKIRHTGKMINCQLQQKKGGWLVKTQKKVAGIAPGQFAVFYTCVNDSQICLGGGEIA